MIKIAKAKVKVFRCDECEKTFYNNDCLIFTTSRRLEEPSIILCEECGTKMTKHIKDLTS